MKSMTAVRVCLMSLMALLVPPFSMAEGPAADYRRLYQEQSQRVDELERRIALLEGQATQDVYLAKEQTTESMLTFLKQTELNGYVSASYFYNFNRPAEDPGLGYSPNTGRGFDSRNDEFMANKFVLRLEHPIEYGPFDWKAGYKVALIFGQDAEFTQAPGISLGPQGDLFEANLTVNVPVGNGLKVTFGKYVTPIGYESSYMEETVNWSGGLQWTFVEPFTHTGVMLGYKLNDRWELKLLANNGWDVVGDNNSARSFMANLAYTPSEKTTYGFTGYGGPEQTDDSANWRRGADVWVDHKFTPQWEGVIELDYGAEDGADLNGKLAEWWAAGAWLIYTPGEKCSVALRTDWIDDRDGARTSGFPFLAPFPTNNGQELYSVTLTLNLKPIAELRVAPEFRWDHSTLDTAFDGHADQITLGLGAAYSY